MNEIVYDQLSIDRCRISYDPEIHCVVMRWLGYVTSAEFRELSLRGLDLLRKQSASKILMDTTHLPIIGKEDQEWVNEKFIPQGMEAGFRVCAMVNSRFYFNRVAIDNVVKRLRPNEPTIEYFESAEDAKEWLRSMPSQGANEAGRSG